MNARASFLDRATLNLGSRTAWLLAAALALFHAWMLHGFVVNFPLQDDFTQLLTVPGDVDDLRSLSTKIAYLVSSSGDHRVVTLRLAALFEAKVLGEINFRTLVFFGNLLCATTGLLVLSTAQVPVRPWLAPLVAALLFSPANWLPQYWASASLQHYSTLAYAFGALFCLNRPGIAWQDTDIRGLLHRLPTAAGSRSPTRIQATQPFIFRGNADRKRLGAGSKRIAKPLGRRTDR